MIRRHPNSHQLHPAFASLSRLRMYEQMFNEYADDEVVYHHYQAMWADFLRLVKEARQSGDTPSMLDVYRNMIVSAADRPRGVFYRRL